MKRDGWHAWAYSLRRNSNSLCYLGLYEHLCWIFPCSLSRNWVVVLSSTSKAGSMIQSRTHPRWMHTYACNFWVIPTLASFQKIQSQCSAVDLSLVLWSNWEWLGQRSAHIWKWGVSADANLSLSSEIRSRVRISCRREFNLCIRTLPSTRMLDHKNMYHCLCKVQLTHCRGCDLVQRADVETLLRLSSNESKHYNVRQLGYRRKTVKTHTHCFENILLNLPAYPPLLLRDWP